jgi:adenylosuccinate synthase
MNLVVIGAQWGDEGKGKIVDYLADGASVIVRFSGGANAGHTIVQGTEQYALHLIPSGILYPDKMVILGSGMVIDPEALFQELDMLKQRGINWEGRVRISDRAHVVLPRYKEIDKEHEKLRKAPIGTTGRGIGIAYALKAERDSVRIADLKDSNRLVNLTDEDKAFISKYADKLSELSIDLCAYIHAHKNAPILYEGAQGALLDIDTGTYPFVSSGMSCAAGAAAQGGIGPRNIDRVLGVFKAYSTRVGNGPFPSEFSAENESALCQFVRDTGREYGVTTGRARRCGYLDLVALRYTCMVNSIDDLVLTHLDVYDSMDEIQACVAYNIDGKIVEDFPANVSELERAKPVLRTFKGWKQELKYVKTYEALPESAKDYIRFIEDFVETEISMISVGYERTETMMRKNPWIKS